MHSAIFYAKPTSQRADWAQFLGHVDKKTENDKTVLRLAENVWLLNLQAAPASLGWLIVYAEQYGIAYGILPFAQAPEWLPASFDPKTS
jgi:hypothetical protein